MQKHTIDGGGDSTPSVTTWTRLEPLPRDAKMERTLQAQVRDPAWMLGRQYQMGEFLADNAGSPIHASLMVEFQNVTTYRPGDDDSKTVPLCPAPQNSATGHVNQSCRSLPIEVHVEREAVTLRLRGSVQLGRYFENLVRQHVSGPDAVISDYRKAFGIAANAAPVSQPPSQPCPPVNSSNPASTRPDAIRFRAIVAGRVIDGEALYVSARAFLNGQQPATVPPDSDRTDVKQILQAFVDFRRSLFSEPLGDSAWQSSHLSYDFGVGSPTKDQNLLLAATDFRGGRVDWFSFSTQTAKVNDAAAKNPATVGSAVFDFLPNHVVFRGMPHARWWNFEDAVTDFGQLDTDHVDLPKLLVMEFAFLFGNDWFCFPLPVPIGASHDPESPQGTLTRVTSLIVADTFGVRTLIRPAEQTRINPGETPWSMYKLSGPGTRSDFILMAPTLGIAEDAPILEQVVLLRDDMSAMAWAVENRLQSELDLPLDAQQLFLGSGQDTQAPPYIPGGPEIYYTIEKTAPYNWIPLVPVRSKQGALYLRRGALRIPDPSSATGFSDLKAHASILEPDHPLFVVDHAVPRSGLRVAQYFRRTRSSEGTTFVWLARKSGVGRGPGWSGLRFDMVRDIKKPETA